MNINLAKKILIKFHGVSSVGWRWQILMRKFAETQQVSSYWWEDRNRKDTEYTIKSWKGQPKIEKESTYEHCVTASFYVKNNMLWFKTTLYDGDYSGRPLTPSSVFKTNITKIFPELNELLLDQIENQAIDIYEERLEEQKQLIIKSIMTEIINQLNK